MPILSNFKYLCWLFFLISKQSWKQLDKANNLSNSAVKKVFIQNDTYEYGEFKSF